MANRFERHFATEGAEPQTLPRAPARQLADTGQGAEARALTEAGRALGGVSQIISKWYEREGNSQLAISEGEAEKIFGEFERTGYANADEHDAAYKTLMNKTIPGLTGKNKSGARKFKAYYTGKQRARWDKIANEKKIRTIAQHSQITLFSELAKVAENYTDPVRAKARINILIRAGLADGSIKTASQAITMRDTFTENWLRADTWRRSTEKKRPDDEVDWQAAADWWDVEENIRGLPEDIVEDFSGTTRRLANAQNAQDKVALENQRSTDRQAILNKLIAADFTEITDFVNATTLSPPEKLVWIEKAETRANAINKGEKDPFTISDGSIYFPLRRKIGLDPTSVTEPELAALVGKGISIDNYNTLLKMITDKDNPLNAPAAKRGQAVIARLRQMSLQLAKEDEDLDSREIELNALAVQNEFDQWVIANPTATDEEMEKKIRALTETIRGEVTLNWFEKFTLLKGRGQVFGLFPSEPERLVNKKIKALQKEDFWETLSDEDRAAIRTRLEQGDTVDNIVRLATQ